jgi:glycosyl transferase family 25
MIIKVLSLKKAIDRRKFIENQLNELGLTYEFADAVDPKTCSKDILEIFSSSKYQSIYNKFPNFGDIGPSLSHYLLRKDFSKNENHNIFMILEDDAKILCTKEELFSTIKIFENSKFDVLLLGFSKCDDYYEKHINIINPIMPVYRVNNKISIGPRYLNSFSGAVGYLVKKKAAKMMSDLLPLSVIADDWGFFSKLGLEIGHTKPMMVRENFLELSSYAGHHNSSQSAYNDKRSWVMFFVNCRKYFYGFLRKTLLYILR